MMEVKCSNNPFCLLLEAPVLGFRVNPSKYVPFCRGPHWRKLSSIHNTKQKTIEL